MWSPSGDCWGSLPSGGPHCHQWSLSACGTRSVGVLRGTCQHSSQSRYCLVASGKGQPCHQLPLCPWDLSTPCHLGRARTQDHSCDLASYKLDRQAEGEAFSIPAPEVSRALEGIVRGCSDCEERESQFSHLWRPRPLWLTAS